MRNPIFGMDEGLCRLRRGWVLDTNRKHGDFRYRPIAVAAAVILSQIPAELLFSGCCPTPVRCAAGCSLGQRNLVQMLHHRCPGEMRADQGAPSAEGR